MISEETASVGEASAGLDGFKDRLRGFTAWVSLVVNRWWMTGSAARLLQSVRHAGLANVPDTLVSIWFKVPVKDFRSLLVTRLINAMALL